MHIAAVCLLLGVLCALADINNFGFCREVREILITLSALAWGLLPVVPFPQIGMLVVTTGVFLRYGALFLVGFEGKQRGRNHC